MYLRITFSLPPLILSFFYSSFLQQRTSPYIFFLLWYWFSHFFSLIAQMYERNTLLSREKDSSFYKKWSVFSKQERNDLLGDYEPLKSTFDKKVQMPNKNSSNNFSSCISSSTTNQVFIEGKVHWYSFKSHITTLFMSDGVAGLVPSNLERVSVRLSMKLLHWIPSYIFFVAVHKQSLSSSKNIVFLLSYLKSDLWATSSSCKVI